MKHKKPISFILTLAMIVGLWSGMIPVGLEKMGIDVGTDSRPMKAYGAEGDENFASGDGSPENPFQIANADQLATLAALVKSGESFNGTSYAALSYKLINDIDLTQYGTSSSITGYAKTGWIPIGLYESTRLFEGTFDGGDCSISGLSISSSALQYAGLFGYVSGGAISGVNVVDCQIATLLIQGSPNDAMNRYVGGVAGSLNNSRVEDCTVSGRVTSTSNYNNNLAPIYIGGMVGGNSGVITNSINLAELSGFNNSLSGSFVGGVAGNNGGTIANSHNTGNVNSFTSGNGATCQAYAGGVVGRNTGTVNTSYNIATVSAAATKEAAYAGGVAGFTSGTVNTSYNTASVSALSSSSSSYAGGVAGYTTGTVNTSYNTASVSASASSSSSYAGGVAGYTKGTMAACVALNTSVTGSGTTNNIYRAVGATTAAAKVSDVYAIKNMEVKGNVTTTGIGANQKNGENIWLVDVTGSAFWTYLGFTEANGWALAPGKLPTLKDVGDQQAAVIPAHVADATPKPITSPSISFENPSITYSGIVTTPAFNIKDWGEKLIRDTDYEVTPSAVNVGAWQVTTKGIGYYIGTTTASFVIHKASLTLSGIEAKSITVDTSTVLTITSDAIEDVTYTYSASGSSINVSGASVIVSPGAAAKITVAGVSTGTATIAVTASAASGNYESQSAVINITVDATVVPPPRPSGGGGSSAASTVVVKNIEDTTQKWVAVPEEKLAVAAVVTTEAKVDTNGKASIQVSASNISSAITTAVEEAGHRSLGADRCGYGQE